MFEKMVLMLDTSELNDALIPYALHLANKMGSELDVVCVIEDGDHTERLVKAYLDKLIEEIKEPGIRKKRSIILRGKAADQIIDYCERNKIDIIAMTRHGHSDKRKWGLTNTADKIIRGTRIPILLVYCREKALPSLKTYAFTHILLPLDGSRAAEAALSYAEAIASKTKVRVSLLQVVSTLFDCYTGAPESYTGDYNDITQALKVEAMDYLKQTAKLFEEQGIFVSTNVIVGSPASEILKYLEKQQVDLIVMSTRERTGFERWIQRSVSQKVLHNIEIPLLLIRPS